jgi:hypothetical protein
LAGGIEEQRELPQSEYPDLKQIYEPRIPNEEEGSATNSLSDPVMLGSFNGSSSYPVSEPRLLF